MPTFTRGRGRGRRRPAAWFTRGLPDRDLLRAGRAGHASRGAGAPGDAKLRPAGKPLPLVAADTAMAFALWAGVPPEARRLAAGLLARSPHAGRAGGPGLPGCGDAGGNRGGPGSGVGAGARALPQGRRTGDLHVGEPVGRPAAGLGGALDPDLLARIDLVLDGGGRREGFPAPWSRSGRGASGWSGPGRCPGRRCKRRSGLPCPPATANLRSRARAVDRPIPGSPLRRVRPSPLRPARASLRRHHRLPARRPRGPGSPRDRPPHPRPRESGGPGGERPQHARRREARSLDAGGRC